MTNIGPTNAGEAELTIQFDDHRMDRLNIIAVLFEIINAWRGERLEFN